MSEPESTEQSQITAPEAPKRIVGKPWVKGQSGNPAGRPRGLIKAIRRLTKDGVILATYLVQVLQDVGLDHKYRLEAARLLAERGFAKPDGNEPPGGPVSLRVTYVDSAPDGLDYNAYQAAFQQLVTGQSNGAKQLQLAAENEDGCLIDKRPAQRLLNAAELPVSRGRTLVGSPGAK